jgi:hypothetical protein
VQINAPDHEHDHDHDHECQQDQERHRHHEANCITDARTTTDAMTTDASAANATTEINDGTTDQQEMN